MIKMMSAPLNKKLLILLLIPLFLLSGCRLKSTEQEISSVKEPPMITVHKDWLKYENPSHKFSFYYPPQWQFVPEIEQNDLLTFSLEIEDDGYYSLLLRVENNPDNLSALDWAVRQYLAESREKMKATYVPVSIGTHQFIKDSGPITPSGVYFGYQICPGNNQSYSFTHQVDTSKENEGKYLTEVEKILATLEFSN